MTSVPRPFPRGGFTLVEIMTVVVILGLLAILALPAFNKARFQTRVSLLSNDLRTFDTGFQVWFLERGTFPLSEPPRVLPDGLEDYIKAGDFAARNPVGGYYKWENFSDEAGVGFTATDWLIPVVKEVDSRLDDGSFATGRLLFSAAENIDVEEDEDSGTGGGGGSPGQGRGPPGGHPPGQGVSEDGSAAQTAKDRLAEIFGNRQGAGWSGGGGGPGEPGGGDSYTTTDQFVFLIY